MRSGIERHRAQVVLAGGTTLHQGQERLTRHIDLCPDHFLDMNSKCKTGPKLLQFLGIYIFDLFHQYVC